MGEGGEMGRGGEHTSIQREVYMGSKPMNRRICNTPLS